MAGSASARPLCELDYWKRIVATAVLVGGLCSIRIFCPPRLPFWILAEFLLKHLYKMSNTKQSLAQFLISLCTKLYIYILYLCLCDYDISDAQGAAN